MKTAWAEIDLNALRHNAGVVRRLAPRAKIMAMLKADAYGHGLLPCADALQGQVDGIAVARLDEAEQLRQAQPHTLILLTAAVLDADALRWCAAQRITVVVHEHATLTTLLAQPQRPAVWLKANTGMNRLGFAPAAFRDAAQSLLAQGLTPVAMTHFASAEEADPTTSLDQIARFDSVCADLPLPRSLANSAAIVRFPQAHADWVRPGIMLYGSGSDAANPSLDLRPVMHLKTRVLAVQEVPAQAAVGYNATWIAPQPRRIATLSFGYGDGYPRVLPQPASVHAHGHLLPVVGRVSMDMLAVDASAVPELKIGDVVTLWGGALPIEQVAASAATISYELLCRLQPRVSRIYADVPSSDV